jgi:hypothetical protein
MFTERKSTAYTDNVSAFPSTRGASVLRSDGGRRFAPATASTVADSTERKPSTDWVVMLMGIAFGVVVSVSAFAAIANIWLNAAMIR